MAACNLFLTSSVQFHRFTETRYILFLHGTPRNDNQILKTELLQNEGNYSYSIGTNKKQFFEKRVLRLTTLQVKVTLSGQRSFNK